VSDVAIAHWAELCNGGGERVAWQLARAFDATLHVGHRDESIEPDDVDVSQLFDGVAGRLASSGGVTQMVANQFVWETAADLRDYETVVTSGNEPLVYVPPEEQTWVAYIHHTSRWATDLLPVALNRHSGLSGGAKRLAEQAVRKAERNLYSGYVSKPDLLVVNSEIVAQRLQRYWGVDANRIRVVYPPVPVDDYGPDAAPTGGHYLSLCRLDEHKGLEKMVRAFDHLGDDYHLKIAGDGAERDRLEAMAPDNVEFLGYVPEQRKADLLAGAKAFLVNAHAEDFGITTVEALASGTPVIGVDEGMTRHLVQDGESGHLFARAGGHLRETIRHHERAGVEWSESEIAAWADRFRPERFDREMHEVVGEARERARVNVEWEPVSERDSVRARADGGGE